MDNTDKMGFIYATSFSLKGGHNSISSGVTTKCYTEVIIQGRTREAVRRRGKVNSYGAPQAGAPYCAIWQRAIREKSDALQAAWILACRAGVLMSAYQRLLIEMSDVYLLPRPFNFSYTHSAL